jgi:ABC-type molybdate transport system substrate-binding protein
MRPILLIVLVLFGCSADANRADGVTPGEAAALNAAADKLDVQAENASQE